jgi:hypothetical protein
VGCGGARGALDCRHGAAEVANGGEQDCGRALAKVVERRRKRGSEMRPREEGKEVEEGSWTRCGTKKRHGQAGAAAGGRRHAWRLRATAARRGGAGKSQQDRASGGRASWWARWCGWGGEGQLAVREIAGEGRQAVQQSNRKGGESGRRRGLVRNFLKVKGVYCKVRFSFKP